jgi:hypothetical protein
MSRYVEGEVLLIYLDIKLREGKLPEAVSVVNGCRSTTGPPEDFSPGTRGPD